MSLKKLLVTATALALALTPMNAFAQQKYGPGGAAISNNEGTIPTYSATLAGQSVTAASATDVFCLKPSASLNTRITHFEVSGTATANQLVDAVVLLRSTLDTGGTSVNATSVSHNPADPAATAQALYYTANPTPGAIIGMLRGLKLFLPAVGTPSLVSQAEWDFGIRNSKTLVLPSGGTVEACLNLNGGSPTGIAINASWEWTEGN